MGTAQQLILPGGGGGGGASDTYWSYVVQLAHFDGTNGSTTFTNASSAGNTLTAVGAAALSTSQSKWGGASLRTSGTGAIRADGASHADYGLGTGEWTVEGWFRCDGITATQDLIAWGQTGEALIRMVNPGKIAFRVDLTSRVTTADDAVAADTWFYLSVSRTASNVHWLHIDGVAIGSWTNNWNYTSSGVLHVGNSAYEVPLVGYTDDFRVTKGVGRYTGSNYTPPTEAHPDS